MPKIQIVVVILVKAFTTAPAEHHGETSFSSTLGGGEEEEERKHQKKRAPAQSICMLYLNSWRLTHTRESPSIGVHNAESLPNQQPCAPQHCEGAQRQRPLCVAISHATRFSSFLLGDRNGKFSSRRKSLPGSTTERKGYQVTPYSKQTAINYNQSLSRYKWS